jgi:hypothetical protein
MYPKGESTNREPYRSRSSEIVTERSESRHLERSVSCDARNRIECAAVPSCIPAWLLAMATLLIASPVLAYRPFDGTDADTAELGHFELELGPAHYYRLGSQNFLIAPATVLNLGILKNTELVIDANDFVALGPLTPGVSRVSLQGDDVLLKHTFREGTLQEKTGVSIAAEGGVLTPEINVPGQAGVGASLDVITSYRWSWGTVHWNEWFELTRDTHADLFTGVILEGPHDWRVRPVAEFFYDTDFDGDQTGSGLLGAIWEVRESFALDLGLRGARVNTEYAGEVRLGFTWAIRVWGVTKTEEPRD